MSLPLCGRKCVGRMASVTVVILWKKGRAREEEWVLYLPTIPRQNVM